MKKTIAILLTVILLTISLNSVSFAAGTAGFSVYIKADKSELRPGDTVKVTFTAADITVNSGIIGLDMEIHYDADRLIPVSIEGVYPEEWGEDGADFSPQPQKNEDVYTGLWQTHVLFDSDAVGFGVKENDKFGISMTFEVKPDAAGGPVVFSVPDAGLNGTSDEPKAVFGKGSELRVVVVRAEKLVLRSDSSYQLEDAFVKGVSIGSTVDTVKSNFENDVLSIRSSDGTEQSGEKTVGTGYTVNLIIGGNVVDSAEIIVKGDVDGNGKIDATDYIIIKKNFLRMLDITGAYFFAADVDGNKKIDSTDYIAIKRHILGISIIK